MYSLSLFALLASIAAATPLTPRQTPPNTTPRSYYANFEVPPNGTILHNLQGLTWTGFQTTTLSGGIIPSDCYYVGPDRYTRCHYAIAGHARDSNASNLPTLVPQAPATSMRLVNFTWAAGPQSYYGMDETVSVLGYNRNGPGGLVYSGRSVSGTYNTALAGATGAPLIDFVMPSDFIFAAYKFNVTTPGADVPVIYIDDVRIVTYTPS